jgi:hypothetical protein
MSWLLRLLEPLLDRLIINRLATRLARQIDIELEAAVDAALDQTEMRIGGLLSRAEARLLAAVGQCDASKVVLLSDQQLDEAGQAAGMVPVSALQAATQDAAKDAADLAAEDILAMLRRQGIARGQRAAYPEIPDR